MTRFWEWLVEQGPIGEWITRHYPRWLDPMWYGYLFSDMDDMPWFRSPFPHFEGTRVERIRCRAKGHPEGVVWFSSGDEPNMDCKTCGEDLG